MVLFDDPCYALVSLLVIFTAIFLRRVVRKKAPLLIGFAGALQFVTSLLSLALMSLHTASVIAMRIMQRKASWVGNEPHVVILGIPYDFRIYSLVMFGLALMALAVFGLRSSARIIDADRKALTSACWINAVVLAISVPAIPLQEFSTMVAVPALAAIAVLLYARRSAVEMPLNTAAIAMAAE